MFDQRRRLGERRTACVARVWPQTTVTTHMRSKSRPTTESTWTLVARIRFLAAVSDQVLSQIAAMVECLAALGTQISWKQNV